MHVRWFDQKWPAVDAGVIEVKCFRHKDGVTKTFLKQNTVIFEMQYANNNLKESKNVSSGMQDYVNSPLLIVQNFKWLCYLN